MESNIESLAYDPRLQLEEPGPPIQALPQQLAGIQQAPVAQAPTNKGWIDTLRGAMGNWGSTLTKGNVIPAIAQAGNIATTLSGAQNTPANAINKLAMNLAGGYGVGGNISPTKMAAPTMQTGNAAPSTQASQFKATINGDLNGDGVVDAKDIKININKSQQPMSNIKQMNTNFSPGGFSNLPGMLGQGPQSFQNDSGVSTGNPESVVNVPVSEATPDERTYALALLAGNPDVGVPGVMKYALDSGTQRINERKAEAEGVAANASLQKAYADQQKANVESAKFLWEQSPAYIQRQGQIEYAKKLGDKQAELYLKDEVIKGASKVPVVEPELRQYGKTYGDVMRTLGTTDLSTIINANRSANARIQAARIGAAGAVTSAGIQTAGLERAAVQNAMTGAIAMRKMMGNIELPLPDNDPNKPSQERDFILGNKKKATPDQMKIAESLDTEISIYRNRLATLGVGHTPQKATAENVYKSKEDIQAAIKKGKVKDGDSVTVNGKTFTVKIKGK